MHRVNFAAGGFALLLLLSLLVTSCQSLVFGEPRWAHEVVGEHIRRVNADEHKYVIKLYYCCIDPAGPGDCYATVRGIRIPKHGLEAVALGEAGIPYAWHTVNLMATQSCRDLT